MRRTVATMLLLLTLLGAAAAVGPDYKRTPFEATPAYKEQGEWKPTEPEDSLSRGPWWHIFNDPVLDGLEQQIDISNQNLKAAEDAYRQARGLVDQARAGFWPTIGAERIARARAAGTGRPT
jgi:outer membrane protein TolC